eukprot:7378066-Prymnesium_polylepis.2
MQRNLARAPNFSGQTFLTRAPRPTSLPWGHALPSLARPREPAAQRRSPGARGVVAAPSPDGRPARAPSGAAGPRSSH